MIDERMFNLFGDKKGVLRAMMEKVKMPESDLKKNMDSFTADDTRMLWLHLSDKIKVINSGGEITCPNGDVMMKKYCDEVCSKRKQNGCEKKQA